MSKTKLDKNLRFNCQRLPKRNKVSVAKTCLTTITVPAQEVLITDLTVVDKNHPDTDHPDTEPDQPNPEEATAVTMGTGIKDQEGQGMEQAEETLMDSPEDSPGKVSAHLEDMETNLPGSEEEEAEAVVVVVASMEDVAEAVEDSGEAEAEASADQAEEGVDTKHLQVRNVQSSNEHFYSKCSQNKLGSLLSLGGLNFQKHVIDQI